jgi:hypothetical protein
MATRSKSSEIPALIEGKPRYNDEHENINHMGVAGFSGLFHPGGMLPSYFFSSNDTYRNAVSIDPLPDANGYQASPNLSTVGNYPSHADSKRHPFFSSCDAR